MFRKENVIGETCRQNGGSEAEEHRKQFCVCGKKKPDEEKKEGGQYETYEGPDSSAIHRYSLSAMSVWKTSLLLLAISASRRSG